MKPALSRRRFLQGSFAVATLASTDPIGWPRAHAAEGSASTPDWVDKPMRWAQLTLVEDDPGKFDPKFWLDYFQRTRSDAVCLSAGGCVAYYPTRVPFHHRSQWLGDTDPFGELVAGCRKLGMVVIARTDPHATYDDMQQAHPDWIAVEADGKPRRHWASPELWVTCALGGYNFEFMTEVKREIMSRYHVDGIFINRWDGSGGCYCAKGPVREFIPIGGQQVRVLMPEAARPKRVHLLAAGKTVPTRREGRFLMLTVPSILDHEVVAIDL